VAKLKVMCARSMHVAVGALGQAFAQAAGHEVAFNFGTVGVLQDKLDAGETADVVISGKPAIDTLDKAGRLAPKSRADIATVRIGVAVRAGAPAPDISTPEALRQALVDAPAVAFSDAAVGGSAGIYLARMFAELGLAEAIQAKGMPQQNGGEVARRVAEGKADIGMTLIAEIVPIAGVRVIGPLPKPLGSDTTYCAGVMVTSNARGAALDFIAGLKRPDRCTVWKEAGFEVA
jgi:molybdate transport system substrate-binding protein